MGGAIRHHRMVSLRRVVKTWLRLTSASVAAVAIIAATLSLASDPSLAQFGVVAPAIHVNESNVSGKPSR